MDRQYTRPAPRPHAVAARGEMVPSMTRRTVVTILVNAALVALIVALLVATWLPAIVDANPDWEFGESRAAVRGASADDP